MPGQHDRRPPDAEPLARGIRLLVLDVDGTLTNSHHEVSDATAAAVASVRGAGIHVMLATGRRYRDVLPIATRLGIELPLVTASGALVKEPVSQATRYRAAFAPGVLEGVVAMLAERGHEPILYTDSFAEGFDFHCRSLEHAAAQALPGQGLREYLHRNQALARVTPHLHAAPPDGVFAGFVMGGRDEMLALEADLHHRWPAALSLHTIRSPRYRDFMCEIAPAGVTKWSGIRSVADSLGIGPESICAVGDDVNDLPMIAAAGLGIAMGNASPAVRAAARRVVSSHDDDGLVDVADLLLS